MSRRTITKDELDAELDTAVDPIRELPPGFPSAHSRFAAIPSQAFLDAGSVEAPAESADALAFRDVVRAKVAELLPPHIRTH